MLELLEDRRVLVSLLVIGLLIGAGAYWNFERSTTVFHAEEDYTFAGENASQVLSFKQAGDLGKTSSISLKFGDSGSLPSFEVFLNNKSLNINKYNYKRNPTFDSSILQGRNSLEIRVGQNSPEDFVFEKIVLSQVHIKSVSRKDLVVFSLFSLVSISLILFSVFRLEPPSKTVKEAKKGTVRLFREVKVRKTTWIAAIPLSILSYLVSSLPSSINLPVAITFPFFLLSYEAYRLGADRERVLLTDLFSLLLPLASISTIVKLELTADISQTIILLTGFLVAPIFLIYSYREDRFSFSQTIHLLLAMALVELFLFFSGMSALALLSILSGKAVTVG